MVIESVPATIEPVEIEFVLSEAKVAGPPVTCPVDREFVETVLNNAEPATILPVEIEFVFKVENIARPAVRELVITTELIVMEEN